MAAVTIGTGTRLGQYEVQDFIGQGAMGVVFRAYHVQLERTGAVKVLQGISPDPGTVARFRHEAQAIAKLRHPNIVDVHDFGESDGTPYMIVEYVPGGSLATRMAEGRLDAATTLRYLRGIAAGLDYAHRHGVVHRDVKPANVLLTAEDTPVIADFGLAKLLEGTSLKSMTGVTTGTPAYMAPEQVTGHDVGPAADRYSLATIAYEMLTGVIPFDGQGLMEMLYAQVHREAPAPSSRHTALNAEVDRVLLRGLAKNPADRWPTATEFVDALETALSDGAATWPTLARTLVLDPPAPAPTQPSTAVLARPKARKEPATVAMAFPSPPPPESVAQPARHTRRRLAIGLAALLILLLLMGVCAVVAQATTLTVSPDRVAPGGSVHVTATKVPANQVGEIQLHSVVVHTYPFQADANGQVSIDIDVPFDEELGDHVVKICWDNTCHKDAPLKVVSGGVAQGSPTPSISPSPGPTAGPTTSPKPGSTPTPKTTPTPHSTPTSTPRTTPRSSPTPTRPPSPHPSPTPTSNPCPGNSSSPTLSPATQTVVGGAKASFSGTNFTPNATVTIRYYAPQTAGSPTSQFTVKASCTGTISFQVTTKVAVLVARTDKVTACETAKGCAPEAKISILL